MHCHVVVPGFVGLGEHGPDPAQAIDAPSLQQLISRGRRTHSACETQEQWLLAQLGLAGPAEGLDWPIAPLRLLGDGGQPGDAPWICADPVHLKFERNRLALADASQFDLSLDEARSLAVTINAHFRDAFELHVLQANRWYARLVDLPEMQTHPLSAVRGGTIQSRQPQGKDAMRWQAMANELQMLLHDHPVNLQREQCGALPVNSLWFWGAGRMLQLSTRPFQWIAADDALARGAGLALGAQVAPVSCNASDWLSGTSQSGMGLVLADGLAAPADYGQPGAWGKTLAQIERDWFVPLHEALRAGRIGMLSLHLLGREQALDVEVTRSDLRRFWRRSQPLTTWLGAGPR